MLMAACVVNMYVCGGMYGFCCLSGLLLLDGDGCGRWCGKSGKCLIYRIMEL